MLRYRKKQEKSGTIRIIRNSLKLAVALLCLPLMLSATLAGYGVNGTIKHLTFTNLAHAAPGARGKLIRDGRALIWENTGEVFLIKGNTAWSILYTPDHIGYRRTIDWSANKNFNLVRGTDLPELNDRAGWDRVDEITRYAHRRGIVIEWWNMKMPDLTASERRQYARHAAQRLEGHPNVIFASNTEGGEVSLSTIRDVNRTFSNAFSRIPILSVHPFRNQPYYPHQGSSNEREYVMSYHKVRRFGDNPRFVDDYRGQNWLTLGMLHQRWMIDGYGILQHRTHGNALLRNLPLVAGEAVYEKMDGTVGSPVSDSALDRFDLTDEIWRNPRRYYRWYTISVLLSGGSGMVYGLRGVGNSGFENRWAYGLPDGGAAEGHRDIDEVLAYFSGKGFDPRVIEPNDRNIDTLNTRSGSGTFSEARGLKRPKLAKVRDRHIYYAFNPYHTWLDIRGLPAGLSIELHNPVNGRTYAAGTTDGSDPFRFEAPRQVKSEYLLYISSDSEDTCPLPVDHWDYCRECGPCSEGEGDCDNDTQCQSDLECVEQEGVDFCQPGAPIENQRVELVAAHSGKCLDIDNASTSNGANVLQFRCGGWENQRFELRPVGQHHQIVALHSGKCLEVENASDRDGANIQQNVCRNISSQRFKLQPVGQHYQIVAAHSGKCIDIQGGSTSNMASAQQFRCGNWGNQFWTLR